MVVEKVSGLCCFWGVGLRNSGGAVPFLFATTGFWLVRMTLALGMAAMPRLSAYLFFWIMCLVC